MRPYDDNAINRYLACDESMDKAGAYSIQGQGSKLIAAIDGDFLAAVGMPLRPIADISATSACRVADRYR